VALWRRFLFIGDVSVEKIRKERKGFFSFFDAVGTGKAARSNELHLGR
jgi:hypothetical protein